MSLIKLLTEKTGDTYEYGCVMLDINFPAMTKIHAAIKPEDIYEVEGERTYGLEDETHVTLFYGLHDGVSLDEVKSIIDKFAFTKILAENVSIFEKDEYDVLKFDVKSPLLNSINKALTKLPHTNDYPKYNAHLTIGYVKPGTSKKYVKAFKPIQAVLIPTNVVFSEADGTDHNIKIKVEKS